jgi:hypothetical protein
VGGRLFCCGMVGLQLLKDRALVSQGSIQLQNLKCERRHRMIVQRVTHHIKPGRMDEAAELLMAEKAKLGHLLTAGRVYTPNIAAINVLVNDLVFEGFAELHKFWEDWGSRPETAEFWEKWNDLTDVGGTNEIWNLHE